MKLLAMVLMALGSLGHHKMRALLTMLGVVFGAGAVIAMLAISEGARKDAMEQIAAMGLRNILIESIQPASKAKADEEADVIMFGLTFQDREALADLVQGVSGMAMARELMQKAWRNSAETVETTVIASEPDLAALSNLQCARGRFLCDQDMRDARFVCVLGAETARDLFTFHDPLGQDVRIGPEWFRVVGILSSDAGGGLSISASKARRSIFIPEPASQAAFGLEERIREAGTFIRKRVEITSLIVQFADDDDVRRGAKLIEHMLEKRHEDVLDYEFTVPLELLAQKQRAQFVWTVVMASIASISLLVGGIGIMNIMLATVFERTREIGIRRAIGARRRDIVAQFLVETAVLSFLGGLLGLAAGFAFAIAIETLADMPAIITSWSLILAIGISAGVGILFGIYPAIRAARMNPVDALRA